MSREVLDIKKEYENLSVAGKRTWEEITEDLIDISQELNLSKKETAALMQRYMAQVVYDDLAYTNNYLNRTQEEFSQRKINQNKLEMQRVSRVYKDQAPLVKDIEQKVSLAMQQKEKERNNNQKR